jgi:transposase-like protein
VLGDDGAIEIAVPRDRNGSFEPQLVAKGQTRLDGFDDRIISLYARGLSVREIQGHLLELYGVEVSPDLISRVTDAVLEEVREWQNRPLDPVYPVIFFDALRVKIRDEGRVAQQGGLRRARAQRRGREGGAGAVDRADRRRQVLAQEPAPAKAGVMNELKTRGVNDVLIAVVDGLKSLPRRRPGAFPRRSARCCR